MLLLITLSIGVIDGLVVSLLSLLLTNIFLGTGPWMLMQTISFTLLMLLTAVLKPLYTHGSVLNRSLFAAWAGLTGLIYGFAISLMTVQLFGMSNFWVYYLNGLAFDVFHALGNVVFFFMLEPIIVPIIQRKFPF